MLIAQTQTKIDAVIPRRFMSNQTKIQSLTLSLFAFVLLCLSSSVAYAQNERMGNSGGGEL